MKLNPNISHFSIFHLVVIISFSSFGQEKNQSTFVKKISINNSQTNRGVTVEEVPDGGYILTGLTSGRDDNGDDVFLMKVDEEGETIWSKTYGGEGDDHGWAVRQTIVGGFIIVGFTDSFGAGGLDVYLIRTDAKGNILWERTFGGTGDEYGWDVRIASDGGFIIASQTNSMGNGEIDAYLIKIDDEGIEEWSATYGGELTDRVFSIQQTLDGGFVAAGITYSYDSDSPNDRDGYLLKVDASGNKEWHRTIGKDRYDVAHSVTLTSDNGFFITGYGESHAKSGGMDVYLIKTNLAGENQWFQSIGSSANERGIKGEQTRNGGFVAIGFTDNNRDLLLVRIDSSGEELWTRTFGDDDYLEFGYTVKETKDGGFILIGHRENLASKKSEIYLIKTDAKGMVN